MKVYYLHHSGVAVLLDGLSLFFDPITEIPRDIFDANRFRILLVSHAHGDHYTPEIWKYDESEKNSATWNPNLFYVVSDDVPGIEKRASEQNVVKVKPYAKVKIGDVVIHTLGSTDQGVSFLVEYEDKTIFFAGDLNWWAWDPKSRPHIDPAVEERDYKSEIARLKKLLDGRTLDLACVPVDPRLDLPGGELFAAKYFIEELKPKRLLPIHFWNDYGVIKRLEDSLGESPTEIGEVTGKNQYVKF